MSKDEIVVLKRKPLPEYNELVIGTVKKIFEHGAFITLDEYGGLEAYCPLNEVSHSWFKSIREVLKEGQKGVFKVIRVNRAKKQVDVSLKRVANVEKKEKMLEWKRTQRAHKLLELAAQKLGKSIREAYREAGWKLEEEYGEILAGLEEAVLRGVSALKEAGVREPWASTLAELAKLYVELPKVSITGVFIVQCLQNDGVERLRKILSAWKNVPRENNIEVRFFVEGSPRYRIDVKALEYKTAEKYLKHVVDTILKKAEEEGCKAEFQRIKRK